MKNSGFTLVELVVVMIIVGVLAVVALPRMFDRNTFDTRAFGDQTQSMLRYAQKVAIAQNRNVFVSFANNRSALCFDAACNNRVRSPANRAPSAACANDGTWMCAALPANINVAMAPAMAGFYFNALGRPFNLGDADPGSSFAGLTVTLTGGGLVHKIIVERETGYVHQ